MDFFCKKSKKKTRSILYAFRRAPFHYSICIKHAEMERRTFARALACICVDEQYLGIHITVTPSNYLWPRNIHTIRNAICAIEAFFLQKNTFFFSFTWFSFFGLRLSVCTMSRVVCLVHMQSMTHFYARHISTWNRFFLPYSNFISSLFFFLLLYTQELVFHTHILCISVP